MTVFNWRWILHSGVAVMENTDEEIRPRPHWDCFEWRHQGLILRCLDVSTILLPLDPLEFRAICFFSIFKQ